ncbi:hypothetical protein C2S52_011737 [Perilla frutescens var. hirtella]|nr:hypothetical protein C2S52_011737 [Perilla frutescens var. hirtella]KAH6785637.1 hypothetical protein C2S51_038092 [Perilla frutescens var. frutescens]
MAKRKLNHVLLDEDEIEEHGEQENEHTDLEVTQKIAKALKILMAPTSRRATTNLNSHNGFRDKDQMKENGQLQNRQELQPQISHQASSEMSEARKDVITFSLKVMVNKQKTKVLFAEADSNFADVLLSFLTLPLGRIVRILKKHYGDEAPAFGSLSSLYSSLANLDSVHFWSEGAKSILLHPRSSSDAPCKRLKLDISDSPPFEDFVCENYKHSSHSFESVSMYYDNVASCIYCHRCPVKREVAKEEDTQIDLSNDGAFTVSTASFMIADDLQILSNAKGLLQIVAPLGVTDIDKARHMNVTFGFAEVMDLLKASLISSTPLSDIVFKKTGEMRKYEPNDQIGKESTSKYSKKMILKVMVQKSTNKLLYAQAEEDFAEFLFSFLIIPLGGVECLLAGKSHNKCMDKLYSSAAHHIDNKYFKTPDAKNRLIKPKIPHGYISKNSHILPLIEEELPNFYQDIALFSSLKFPKGQGSYLKAPSTFMVTDDLTVTPFCVASTLSFLKGMKISVSDIKEVELQIGLKEALGILRASLTSTRALSNGLNLINLVSLKLSKQEY